MTARHSHISFVFLIFPCLLWLVNSCENEVKQFTTNSGQHVTDNLRTLDTLKGYATEPMFDLPVNSEINPDLITGHEIDAVLLLDTNHDQTVPTQLISGQPEKFDSQIHLIHLDLPSKFPAQKSELLFDDPAFKDSVAAFTGFGSIAFDYPEPKLAGDARFKDLATTNIRYMDVEQNLLANFVWGVYEDKSGNIWMSIDGGLCLYDGNSFWNFDEYLHPAFRRIWAVDQDDSGNIWICTATSILKYDGINFQIISTAQGLDVKSKCLLVDDENNVWIGTEDRGLVCFDGKQFTFYNQRNGLVGDNVTDIKQLRDGNIYAASDNGLSIVSEKSVASFHRDENPFMYRISGISEDRNGVIWLSTFGFGVNKFNGFHYENYNLEHGLPDNFFSCVFAEDNGDIWLGSFGKGLYKLSDDELETFDKSRGLSHQYITQVYEDRNENLWVSTRGGGVSILRSRSFHHLTRNDGLTAEEVMTIAEDSIGNLWFGCTYGGGFSKFDGRYFYRYRQHAGLSGITANCIHPAADGSVWIGTFGWGLYHLSENQFDIHLLNYSDDDRVVRDITEDKSGRLWLSTDGGIFVLINDSLYTFPESTGMNDCEVWKTIEALDGSMWFCTETGGVVRYKDGRMIRYTEKEGLANNMVNTLEEDRFGNMWFGTGGAGLVRFDGETFTQFDSRHGLSFDLIWSITEDKYGNLWVGTEIGMNYVNQHMEKSEPSIYNFGKSDGMKGLTCFANSALIDSKNRLWFGTEQCVTMLNLDEMGTPTSAPKVAIQDVAINGNFVDYRKEHRDATRPNFNGVEKFTNKPNDLVLTSDNNHLTFSFTGIDWNALHKVSYSYRMVGLDTNWTKPSGESKADYRNLPYGDFEFQVKAMGQGQVWSNPVSFEFTVLPPWWHTWWARVIYAIVAVVVFWIAVRVRTLTLRRRQKSLENDIWSATKNIVEQKAEIERQHLALAESHQEIHDSIAYAKRIQDGILPGAELMKTALGESFVLFAPKDVVAGDFYWVEVSEDLIFFAVCDCTGHGVPGAMVSVMCNSALNRCIRQFDLTDPAKILDKARELVISEFEKSDKDVKDGMDISLAVFERKTQQIHWAGANNPLWIFKHGTNEFIELKADKQPIGKFENARPFTKQTIDVKTGDLVYLFSDGFPDQFGGENLSPGRAGGKKYKYKNFREFIAAISLQSLDEQKCSLEKEFVRWKGNFEQVDDVCIIGVRIE